MAQSWFVEPNLTSRMIKRLHLSQISSTNFKFGWTCASVAKNTRMRHGDVCHDVCVVFKGKHGLLSFDNKVRENVLQNVSAFTGRCRPPVKNTARLSIFPEATTLRTPDNSTTRALDVKHNVVVGIGKANRRADIRTFLLFIAKCPMLANVDAAFSIKQASKVNSVVAFDWRVLFSRHTLIVRPELFC